MPSAHLTITDTPVTPDPATISHSARILEMKGVKPLPNAIEIKDLHKSYKQIKAVKGINLAVGEGSFFALLGKNGAGKSTTINIIATLVRKTSGEVTVNGHRVNRDDRAIRRDIGVVSQGHTLDRHLSVRENIIHRGALYGLSRPQVEARLHTLAPKIGVVEFLGRRYGHLSGGQKRRADILRALINEPTILILDEPTTGLDPHTRQSVWETILRLKRENGLTVFLTTHYMEEAAGADHIVIMDRGTVRASGTPEQLRLMYSTDRLILIPRNTDSVAAALRDMHAAYTTDRDRLVIPLTDSLEVVPIINRVKDAIAGLEVIRGNMDDVFINVTREGAAV